MLGLQARGADTTQIVDIGFDHAVHQTITSQAGADGQILQITNRFTLLENCLHYFEDNQWKASEDLIEIAPGGAVARRGPTKPGQILISDWVK